MAGASEQRILHEGDIFQVRWKVDRLLHEDERTTLYAVSDQSRGGTADLRILPRRLKLRRPPHPTAYAELLERLGQLTHESLATPLDLGSSSDARVYVVSTPARGLSLARLLEGEGPPLPWSEVLLVAIQLARALRAVHARELLHLDLRPENVVVLDRQPSAGGARIALIHPGVAEWLEPAPGASHTEGPTEAHYLAPEQIAARPLTARTDSYALGAILFHLISGVPPFDGESTAELKRQILEAPPPDPASVGHRRPCSARLVEMLQRCLAKRPEERPTAAALVAELKAIRHSKFGLIQLPDGSEQPTLPADGAGGGAWTQLSPTDPGLDTGDLPGDEPSVAVTSTWTGHSLPPLPDLTAARESFGHYWLLGVLAQGGMGRLYLAEPKSGGGLVAVKRVLPHLTHDPLSRKMFLNEAQIAGRLQHPNIVRTHEVGAIDDQPFITMEYLAGEDLHSILGQVSKEGQQAMPPDIAAAIALECARGLHHAHELPDEAGRPAGIIHRDVNPSNVFVTYDGRVKLLDFGVAKLRSRESTRSGSFKGKLSYSAPEQLGAGPVDRRADVFCLGITLWECLTGLQLFSGEHEGGRVEAVRSRKIPPPTCSGWSVPAALVNITMRALERAPAARQATAAELAEQLQEYLGPQQPAQRQERIAQWLRGVMPRDRVRAKLDLGGSAVAAPLDAAAPALAAQTVVSGPPSAMDVAERPLAIDPPAEPPRGGGRALLAGVALLGFAGLLWWFVGHADSPAPATAPPTVSVEVESDPPGAMIMLNGEPTGLVTPARLGGLRPGDPLRLSLNLEGRRTAAAELRPEVGRDNRVKLELARAVGVLRLLGRTRGMRVFIDGKEVAGDRLELPLGAHALRVERGDELLTSQTLEVREDETRFDLGRGRRAE